MKRIKLHIYSKLLVVFLLISLLPMAMLGAISYYSARRVVQEQIVNKLEELARLAMQLAEQEIAHTYQETQNWANLESMQGVLTPGTNTEITDLLKGLHNKSSRYHSIFCLNKDGTVVASSKPQLTGINKATEAWFKQALAGNVFLEDVKYLEDKHSLGLTIAAPIYAKTDQKQVIGVLAAKYDWKHVYPLLESIKVKTGKGQDINAHIMLINKDGLPIFAPEFERKQVSILQHNIFDNGFTPASFSEPSGHIISIDEHKNLSLVGYKHSSGHGSFPGLGWTSIALYTTQKAFVPVISLQIFIIGSITILIAMVIITANIFAKQLTSPLAQLTKTVKRIASKDHNFSTRTGETITIETGDEIGELSQAFNHMCQVLQNRETNLNASYHNLKLANQELRSNTKCLAYTLNEIKRVVQLAIREKNLRERFSKPALDKCWEIKNCNETHCPAYENPDRRCWQIAGTLCEGEIQSQVAKKTNICKDCDVYKKASPNQYYLIGEMFNDLLELLQEKQEKLADYAQNLEKKVKERTKELEQSHKELEKTRQVQLEMKDQFLSHVSHELRSPLTAIHQFVTILLDGLAGETSAEQDEYLGIILKNTQQLRSMIGDLLEVTRAEAGTLTIIPEHISLEKLITETIDSHSISAKEKEIVLTTNIADIPTIYADPTRVQEVLTNLMTNALKFTPNKGEITISANIYELDNNFVCASVTDNGSGISPHGVSMIFERMFQEKIYDTVSDASRQGLGLGLYICKELLRRQGGNIWVESKLGKGSTFFFTLPIEGNTKRQINKNAEQKSNG